MDSVTTVVIVTLAAMIKLNRRYEGRLARTFWPILSRLQLFVTKY